MGNDILIVDDEADICKLVQGILEDEGYKTRLAANAQQARTAISQSPPALIIQDIWLQGSDQDGLQILETVKTNHPYIPVIMISGHGTIETAVTAIKKGAYDFIEKPFKAGRLLLMVNRALETAELRRENEILKQQKAPAAQEMVGNSDIAKTLRQMIERAASVNSSVLLTGEPGTGKDLAARSIHTFSARKDKPYMVLNCATLHPDRIEAELFGVEKNSNTPGQAGILEQAHGGTLLLDEVCDMPLETQGKIVRAIQEQRFQRLGGAPFVQVDVRIIASTNYDLEQRIREGSFRQDLYYRLNVIPIHIAPLKEHSEDIAKLSAHFIRTISLESGLPAKELSKDALKVLQHYDWPGNIRQLRNVLEWVMIMHNGGEDDKITSAQLPPDIKAGNTELPCIAHGQPQAFNFSTMPLREARECFEREYLAAQIKNFEGNISKTAKFIGMERSALHRKLKSLDILTTDKQNPSDEAQAHGQENARKIA